MTRAMILAAGLGTRLRPLTLELPKPLVWLGDQPIVAHIARRLSAAGIEQAALNTHHLAEAFTPSILKQLPLAITVLHEREILGTAGGVANAAEVLGGGDVVVWNGDILLELDCNALLSAHRDGDLPATLAIAPRSIGEGTVGLDSSGRVVRLRGERFGDEVRGGDFIGVQVIAGALRRDLPSQGCLVGDVYLPLLRRGGRIASHEVSAPWDDIGTISAYLAANARWLARVHPGAGAFVGEGASISREVEVIGSVIGAGAVIEGQGALRGCVVWPGARLSVRAPLESAVVTTEGRLAFA